MSEFDKRERGGREGSHNLDHFPDVRMSKRENDETAVLVDPHLVIAELERIGLRGGELERDQATQDRGVYRHGVEVGPGSVDNPTVRLNDEITDLFSRAVITSKIDSTLKRRRQFPACE